MRADGGGSLKYGLWSAVHVCVRYGNCRCGTGNGTVPVCQLLYSAVYVFKREDAEPSVDQKCDAGSATALESGCNRSARTSASGNEQCCNDAPKPLCGRVRRSGCCGDEYRKPDHNADLCSGTGRRSGISAGMRL